MKTLKYFNIGEKIPDGAVFLKEIKVQTGVDSHPHFDDEPIIETRWLYEIPEGPPQRTVVEKPNEPEDFIAWKHSVSSGNLCNPCTHESVFDEDHPDSCLNASLESDLLQCCWTQAQKPLLQRITKAIDYLRRKGRSEYGDLSPEAREFINILQGESNET